MLGFAWQHGLVPVSLDAILRAIELNGVAVDQNKQAFAWGRIAGAEPESPRVAMGLGPDRPVPETLDNIVSRRIAFLTAYQDANYAARYAERVARVREVEAALGTSSLTEAVARSLFKLMAYKDEYEVARLHVETEFLDEVQAEFEGDYKVVHHLAPPLLSAGRDARGRPLKRAFGPWVRTPFRLLARLKRLRGSALNPFGFTAERRMERDLIRWFESLTEAMLARIGSASHDELVAIARMPLEIRGFGPVKQEAVDRIRPEADRRWAAIKEQVGDAPSALPSAA